MNIKEYNVEEYRGKIGTVFRDFKIFAATVSPNAIIKRMRKINASALFFIKPLKLFKP